MSRKIEMPDLVTVCPCCRGRGQYRQRFLEGRLLGSCEACDGAQFVYRETGRAVPASVREQIARRNGLVEDQSTTTTGALLRGYVRLRWPGNRGQWRDDEVERTDLQPEFEAVP
jgi:hypothetical protein